MKWADIDWSVIRISVLTLMLVLAIGVVLLQTSMQFHTDRELQYQVQHNRFLAISRKYFSLDDDRRIVTELYPRFVALHEKGIIGQEQRLNWYEVLHRLGEQVVSSLNYQILSRQPYQPSFPLTAGGFQINSSTMKVNMDLLHENDLATLLHTLEREAAGVFSVEHCELQAIGVHTAIEKAQPNVRASCDLRWFSLTLANGKDFTLP